MIYRFGPFTADAIARRLTRGGTEVALPDRHLEVLLRLVAQPGEVVSKAALVQAAWPDVAVTDNSLEQAISVLRKALAPTPAAGEDRVVIETVPRRGYRFAGSVARETSRPSDDELEALLAPHRAWLEGRAALEALSVHQVADAERVFRRVVEASPLHAAAHVGLANALVFRFESTRIDLQPDGSALADALPRAREGCRLDPQWGEAWATLGFVLHRSGHTDEGIAAVRRAIELEPDNWRHLLRLAFLSWGEERLRAAQRALKLMPGLALAHWLAATVHVAREVFAGAARELSAGAAAQDDLGAAGRFGGVGLHWLSGLVALRHGHQADASRHFRRELAFEATGHLYARECCAATWYALGAMAFHQGDQRAAAAAFAEALHRVPGHPFALAATVRGAGPDDGPSHLRGADGRAGVEAALARAVSQVRTGAEVDAGQVLAALQASPPGPAGWHLPVEPMLQPWITPSRWRSVLAVVRSRAA